MLSKEVLDGLWQKGYCRALISQIGHTPPGTAGVNERLQLVEAHVTSGCVDCHYANVIREVEARTACAMGDEAITVYNRGGDIRGLPKFGVTFKHVFDAGVACGKVDKKVAAWLIRMVPQRAGQPYPYTEEEDATQAN
jgi:hypothetical protein